MGPRSPTAQARGFTNQSVGLCASLIFLFYAGQKPAAQDPTAQAIKNDLSSPLWCGKKSASDRAKMSRRTRSETMNQDDLEASAPRNQGAGVHADSITGPTTTKRTRRSGSVRALARLSVGGAGGRGMKRICISWTFNGVRSAMRPLLAKPGARTTPMVAGRRGAHPPVLLLRAEHRAQF
jgi:hypothetical protein